MRGLKLLLKLLFILIWATCVTVSIWYVFGHGDVTPSNLSHLAQKNSVSGSSRTCSNCGKSTSVQDQLKKRYNHGWRKQEGNLITMRSQLISSCRGASKAIVTQANTPVGSQIEYDGEKKKPLRVTPSLFSIFSKEQPFKNFPWETCAMVGNGGILTNSSCGEEIDSAQFIIRCNLPPLGNGYTKDVGNKTNLVTANPSILLETFKGLTERRRPFVESMSSYGNSLLLLPAFSYSSNTAASLRALYTLQEFESPSRPVFFNPKYLSSLARFWRARGLKANRLSTGFIMVSLALELCTDVHLYGFWPFPSHPHGNRPLTNHYYDNQQGKKVHDMPTEFEQLLRLHERGVLRVHLGKCVSDPSAGIWISRCGTDAPGLTC
ncbi:hypothetical protein AAFF_G00051770 [Aldrovandia affinis]|uniref:Uncharacterized protein n=1 Tax=Aldrovandia affinis TaxID=143900 RepID=A0AAD7T5R4_9TELE|nr:hypothetical protein AAFF_G00051770 [Aldrovandia affinis]